MSTIRANAIVDSSGGNTATVNGILPIGAGTVLLGTLTTTSGTSQSLSGLNLAGYAALMIVVDGVSFTANVTMTLNTFGIVTALGATLTNGLYGTILVSLATGVATSISASAAAATNGAAVAQYADTTISTATTTLTFAGGTFDAGQILIYGVK